MECPFPISMIYILIYSIPVYIGIVTSFSNYLIFYQLFKLFDFLKFNSILRGVYTDNLYVYNDISINMKV